MPAKRGWKCRHCREMQTRHQEPLPGVFRCEDGTAATFERFVTKPTRRTQSFSAEELDLWHFIVTGLLHGRDISMARRHPLWSKMVSKVHGMRSKSKAAAEGEEA